MRKSHHRVGSERWDVSNLMDNYRDGVNIGLQGSKNEESCWVILLYPSFLNYFHTYHFFSRFLSHYYKIEFNQKRILVCIFVMTGIFGVTRITLIDRERVWPTEGEPWWRYRRPWVSYQRYLWKTSTMMTFSEYR